MSTAEVVDKRFATLQARLALAGYMLVRGYDDRDGPLYIVSRAALTVTLHTLAAVDDFTRRAEQHDPP